MSGCDHELGAELSEPSEPDQSREVASPASHREERVIPIRSGEPLEPYQSREAASPASHKEERVIPIRLQRDKRPPAWLEDFITGGELEESLAVQPETEIAAVHPIEMAQRQLEHPPAISGYVASIR